MSSQTATHADADRSPGATGPPREVAHHPTPSQIGRFTVLRKLGEGGMGVVYAAYDEELERKVAIKLLRGEFRGVRQSVGQARLLREAQAMARLSHPNVVQVYEVGPFGSGVFLAMEFVHGCNLREWLQRGPKPWRAVLAAYVQAGHGLAAAHAAGIVHRDFKPDNALIGEDDRVRVVDFGLARPGEPTTEEMPAGASASRMAVELTQAGSFVGTPAYMAPEQHRREPADARSDQFSFCVALFEALYGMRPYAGNDVAEVKESVLYGEPVDPPRDADAPPWVHRALLRGLLRAPEQRFPDMPALLAALAADPSLRRRRRLASAGVVLACGLAAGGGGLAVHQLREASASACVGGRERLADVWDPTVAAATRAALVATGVAYAPEVATRVAARLDAYADTWADMHREACETHRRGEQSDALFDLRVACLDDRRTTLHALAQVLAAPDPDVVEKAVQAAEHLPPLARCADPRTLLAEVPPPDDPVVARAAQRLHERLATARVKHDVGQFQAVLAELRQIHLEAEALGYAPVLAAALHLEGIVEDDLGNYAAAEALLVRAVASADAAGDDDRRVHAQVDLLRVVGLRQARFAEGLRHAEFVRGALRRLPDPGPPEAHLEARVSELYLQQGALDQAAEHVDRSLDLQRRLYGEASPAYALAVDARGTLHFFRGELADALADYQRSVAIQEEAYGANHPILGNALNNVGAVQLTRFDNDAAEATFRRAQAILEAAYGQAHPTLGTLQTNLGLIAVHQGRPLRAIEEFRHALAIYEQQLPADHPTIGECLVELGNAQLHADQLAEARQTFERALAVYRNAFGPGHAKTTLALASLGAAQLRAGDSAAAEQTFDRAIAEFRGDPGDPDLGLPYAGLGELLLAQGHLDQAAERLAGALDRVTRSPSAAPFQVAEVQFLLARALRQQNPANEPRARALAGEARDNFSRVGAGFQARADAVQAWLARSP